MLLRFQLFYEQFSDRLAGFGKEFLKRPSTSYPATDQVLFHLFFGYLTVLHRFSPDCCRLDKIIAQALQTSYFMPSVKIR